MGGIYASFVAHGREEYMSQKRYIIPFKCSQLNDFIGKLMLYT